MEDLDALPFPDFSLIEGLQFKKPMRVTPVSTSRGCPYECSFCSVSPMFGRRYRFRSVDSVIAELSQFKHKHIFFYDDNFTADKARTKELLTRMIELGITPGWSTQVRADIAKDEELVNLMARANCQRLCIGFESVNPETLKKYNKKQTPEDVTKCIKVLHKYHIKVHGMFISEGYSDIYNKLGLDSFQLSILTPILGSKLYTAIKDAKTFIVEKYPTDWKLFDGVHVVHWPDNLSPFELQKQTMQALKKYYSKANIVKMFLKGKITASGERLLGYSIIKKWETQNKDYLAKLKQIRPLKKSSSAGSPDTNLKPLNPSR